jgi:PAS domain S-box-containing protein
MNAVSCLIVDDLEENLVALEGLLRREGLVLLKARSGMQALEILLKQEVALALIDVQMPEMDGFELAELMRGTERTRRVPIIFLTAGRADRQRKFRGYEAGAVDFLEKPLEPDILRSKAEVFFELYRQREDLRDAAEQNARLLAESRRSEEAVRRSEASLRLALEASSTGLWTWELSTDRVTWSPECYRILAVQEGEFEGTASAFLQRVHPEDRPRVETTFREAFANHRLYECDYRVVRPGGEVVWVTNRGRADYDTKGDPVRMLGTLTEVTDRKHAELELARLNQALQDADQRKDEFLATLAHELRNPLAPMRNSLSILRMKQSDPSIVARAGEVMERQMAHMVRLIDDLMDAARISQGKIGLRRERIEVRTVLDHALEASRALVDVAQHHLRIEVPEEPLWIEADFVRMSQVVANLLNNAAKYTPAGGTITLSAAAEADTAVIRVSDNGIGLSAEMIQSIFELFAQADDTRDRSQGGLGIGLALVRNLVELHGGTVQAESPGVGSGSTFSVRLPLATKGADASPTLTSTMPEATPAQARHRVLVVDDNADSAWTLAHLLTLRGHDARVVHDGPGAISAAVDCRPDLVLLDLGLPGMNGNEVCRLLRADREMAGTTIVALTGWGSDADKQRAREAGFDHHLVKPIEFEELEGILRNLDKCPTPSPGRGESRRHGD